MANTSTPQMIAAILFVFFLLLKSNNMNFTSRKDYFMHYITIIICCSFLALCFTVSRNVSRFKKSHGSSHANLLERESEANAVRKADISSLPYIQIPLDTLPLAALDACGHTELASELRALATKQILNLSMYTNTDLKMLYGPANLDTLSACDEAYTSLILLLNKIGKTLLDADRPTDAKSFLAFAISIDSDITTSYTMLASIYADDHDASHIDELIRKAESITSLSGKTIQIKLHSIKSGLK